MSATAISDIACSTTGAVTPSPSPLPGGCLGEVQAALRAVAPLGYAVRTIQIEALGFPCGVPFPQDLGRSPAPGCPGPGPGPSGYVTFYGTAKVAGLTFAANGAVVTATIVAFEVPPTGPAPA